LARARSGACVTFKSSQPLLASFSFLSSRLFLRTSDLHDDALYNVAGEVAKCSRGGIFSSVIFGSFLSGSGFGARHERFAAPPRLLILSFSWRLTGSRRATSVCLCLLLLFFVLFFPAGYGRLLCSKPGCPRHLSGLRVRPLRGGLGFSLRSHLRFWDSFPWESACQSSPRACLWV